MAKKEQTFAQQYAELEQIAAWFERGNMDLEEALKKFERGLALADDLQKQLAAVDERIRDIKQAHHTSQKV